MGSRRGFFGRLFGLGAILAAEPLAAADVPAVETPTPSAVKWWCMRCEAPHETPAIVFPSVKRNLDCSVCGSRQPYMLHIKKFDPQPTGWAPEFQHNALMANLIPTSELVNRRVQPIRHSREQEILTEATRVGKLKFLIRQRLGRPRLNPDRLPG